MFFRIALNQQSSHIKKKNYGIKINKILKEQIGTRATNSSSGYMNSEIHYFLYISFFTFCNQDDYHIAQS